MRTCIKCGIKKQDSEFYVRRDKRVERLRRECIPCFLVKNRGWHKRNPKRKSDNSKKWRKNNPELSAAHYRKYKYGITLDEYNTLLSVQDGKCAICHKEETRYRLSVDHCHRTGEIRGLLCGNCNRMIGLARNNVGLLDRAVKYLAKFPPPYVTKLSNNFVWMGQSDIFEIDGSGRMERISTNQEAAA